VRGCRHLDPRGIDLDGCDVNLFCIHSKHARF
jgi:hypothetical protein